MGCKEDSPSSGCLGSRLVSGGPVSRTLVAMERGENVHACV